MSQDFIFSWYLNETHDALRLLHDNEPGHEQDIADIAAELRDSNLFWLLFSRYSDALQEAKGDAMRIKELELVMFARMVAIGSLRRTHVFEGKVDVDGRR